MSADMLTDRKGNNITTCSNDSSQQGAQPFVSFFFLFVPPPLLFFLKFELPFFLNMIFFVFFTKRIYTFQISFFFVGGREFSCFRFVLSFFFLFLSLVPVDSGKQLDRAKRQKAGKGSRNNGTASLTTGDGFSIDAATWFINHLPWRERRKRKRGDRQGSQKRRERIKNKKKKNVKNNKTNWNEIVEKKTKKEKKS